VNLVRSFISRNPWVVPAVAALHRFLYRATGGRIGARAGSTTMLLLTTRGRRSGRLRETPLLYVEDGRRWVVVASNGGREREPAWWLNLKAEPRATVRVGRERHEVRARPATGEETRRLWPRLMDSYEFFDDYQGRTQREIPVVVLERAEEATGRLAAGG